jgi:hypothetical protein
MTRRFPLRLALALFMPVLLAPAVSAQGLIANDPDEDIFDRFLSDPRGGNSVIQTPVLDMEADEKGRLLMAYGVIDAYENTARVEVVVRLKDGTTWNKLATLSIDDRLPGLGTKIKAVSVAIANKVGGVTDNNIGHVAAVFEQQGTDWLVHHSGPMKSSWKRMTPSQLVITGVAAKPHTDPMFMNPSIAVIPTKPSDFTSYITAIAVAMPGPTANDSTIKLIWMDTYSPDYFGPELYTIAGPGSTVLDGKFGRPSLTADINNAYWGVAFDDLNEPRVRIISGKPGSSPNAMSVIWTSGSSDHHPTIRAHEGTINLTTLGTSAEGGAHQLRAYHGVITAANSLFAFPTIDPRCLTPGDIDIKRDDVSVAARCWDNASGKYRISSFEFKRSRGPVYKAVLEDRPSFVTRQPRIAVAPPGAGVVFQAVGFATDRTYSLPGGISGADAVMLDP